MISFRRATAGKFCRTPRGSCSALNCEAHGAVDHVLSKSHEFPWIKLKGSCWYTNDNRIRDGWVYQISCCYSLWYSCRHQVEQHPGFLRVPSVDQTRYKENIILTSTVIIEKHNFPLQGLIAGGQSQVNPKQM